VGPDRDVRHVHEPLQGGVELAGAVELARAPALFRDLAQGLGRARRGWGRALGRLVLELVDAVAQARELREGRAEPPLLPGQRAVHGDGEGEVADGGREGGLRVEGERPARRQGRQEGPHDVGEGEQAGLARHPSATGRPSATARAATSSAMKGQTGKPRAPITWPSASTDSTRNACRASVSGSFRPRRLARRAEAVTRGRGRARRRPSASPATREPGPDEGDEGEEAGQAQKHAPHVPPHADVEDRVGGRAGIGHRGRQSARGDDSSGRPGRPRRPRPRDSAAVRSGEAVSPSAGPGAPASEGALHG